MGPVSVMTGLWRERQWWRVARCGGGAHSLIPSGGAHPLFLPGGGEEQQGEEGGKGKEGSTRCSCRARVTSRGRGKGERRWGGVWAGVEGDPAGDFWDRRVGSGGAVGLKVGVSEGRVPTGGKGRAVAEVTGVGLKEGLGAGTCDEAGAKVGVEKSTADKVCAVEGGGGARGSGVWDRREKSGVFEGEEGIGKVGEGLANARETG